MTQLDRLEALAEKAIARPWWVEGMGGITTDGRRDQYVIHANDVNGKLFRVGQGNRSTREDADLVVAAVNLLPDLVRVAREYANHKLTCPAFADPMSVYYGPCDCGFADIPLFAEVESDG